MCCLRHMNAMIRAARLFVLLVAARPEPLRPTDRLVLVRIPKTGTKTLAALMRSGWLFGGGASDGCRGHRWLGGSQITCEDSPVLDELLRASGGGAGGDDARRACAFAGHCSFSALDAAAAPAARELGLRLRWLLAVREPTARALSEYRHVCASGGAWD